MKRLSQEEKIIRALRDIGQAIPSPDPVRQANFRQTYKLWAKRISYSAVTGGSPNRLNRQIRGMNPFLRLRRQTMTALILALILALGTGGVMYAADESAPGDALYELDQTMEEVRLKLTTNEEARLKLQIRLADERLEEMEGLAGKGDQENFGKAQVAYGQIISELAQAFGGGGGADAEAHAALVEQAWSNHESRLTALLASGHLNENATAAIEAVLAGERGNRPDDVRGGQPDAFPGMDGEGEQNGTGESQGNGGQGSGQGAGGQGPGQGSADMPGNSGQAPGQGGGSQGSGSNPATCAANLSAEEIAAITALAEEYGFTYEEVALIYCRAGSIEQAEQVIVCQLDRTACDGTGPADNAPGGGQGGNAGGNPHGGGG